MCRQFTDLVGFDTVRCLLLIVLLSTFHLFYVHGALFHWWCYIQDLHQGFGRLVLQNTLSHFIYLAKYRSMNILNTILNVQIGIEYVAATKQENFIIQLDLKRVYVSRWWMKLMQSMGFGPRTTGVNLYYQPTCHSCMMVNGGIIHGHWRCGCALSPLLFALIIIDPMLSLLVFVCELFLH